MVGPSCRFPNATHETGCGYCYDGRLSQHYVSIELCRGNQRASAVALRYVYCSWHSIGRTYALFTDDMASRSGITRRVTSQLKLLSTKSPGVHCLALFYENSGSGEDKQLSHRNTSTPRELTMPIHLGHPPEQRRQYCSSTIHAPYTVLVLLPSPWGSESARYSPC